MNRGEATVDWRAQTKTTKQTKWLNDLFYCRLKKHPECFVGKQKQSIIQLFVSQRLSSCNLKPQITLSSSDLAINHYPGYWSVFATWSYLGRFWVMWLLQIYDTSICQVVIGSYKMVVRRDFFLQAGTIWNGVENFVTLTERDSD